MSSSTQPNLWFSSLTRSKGKSVMRPMDTVPDPPQPEVNELSTSEMTTPARMIPTPARTPQPRLSSTPPSSPPKGSCAYHHSLPTYPANLEAVPLRNPSPTPEIMERPPVYTASRSDKSTPLSSVYGRVPSLPTTPPAVQPQHTVTFVPLKNTPLGQTTTTRLNLSSSSRFTLSIPLLGCAKVPLGRTWEGEGERYVRFCFDSTSIHSRFRSTLVVFRH